MYVQYKTDYGGFQHTAYYDRPLRLTAIKTLACYMIKRVETALIAQAEIAAIAI